MPYKRSADAAGLGPSPSKYAMYKRTLPASFNVAMPPIYGRSTLRRRTYRRSSRAGSYGPYRAMTSGARHTNSVYPRPEVKFTDANQLGAAFVATPAKTAMTDTGSGACVNQIVQNGSTPGRIGARIAVKSCAYRFKIDLGTTPVPCNGRVLLIWDKQSNAATGYVWTDVFVQNNYLAYMNVGYTNRFTILRNQQFSLSPQGDQSLFFEGYVKINMESVWGAAVTAAAVPTSGALVIMYISDQAAAVNQPLLSGCWRTRYIDS